MIRHSSLLRGSRTQPSPSRVQSSPARAQPSPAPAQPEPSLAQPHSWVFYVMILIPVVIKHSVFLASFPSLLGKGKGCSHGHIQPFSEKLALLLFRERQRIVVMIIYSLFF